MKLAAVRIVTALVAFELAWFGAYFGSGPAEWWRWAWLRSHRFHRLAERERRRIYRAHGLAPPERTE